jgi:hypothetical protein
MFIKRPVENNSACYKLTFSITRESILIGNHISGKKERRGKEKLKVRRKNGSAHL